MWGFFAAGSGTVNTHFPCHSLPGFNKFCVLKRHESTGLSYKFWSRGLLAPVKFNPSLPTHFFPEDDGLRKMLIPFLRETSKKGCAANVSETGMCQFIPKVGCVVSYILCVCGTQIHVLDMLQWGFSHTFFHALCSACAYTLHLHMGVLTLFRIEWTKQGRIIQETFAVWCK